MKAVTGKELAKRAEEKGWSLTRIGSLIIDGILCMIPGTLGAIFWYGFVIAGKSGDVEVAFVGGAAGFSGVLVATLLLLSMLHSKQRLGPWMWAGLLIGLSPVAVILYAFAHALLLLLLQAMKDA